MRGMSIAVAALDPHFGLATVEQRVACGYRMAVHHRRATHEVHIGQASSGDRHRVVFVEQPAQRHVAPYLHAEPARVPAWRDRMKAEGDPVLAPRPARPVWRTADRSPAPRPRR